MIVMPNIVIEMLTRGAGVRISCVGLTPDTMVQYAAAAAAGGARLDFVVGDVPLFPDTMNRVGSAGASHVLFDFVSKD